MLSNEKVIIGFRQAQQNDIGYLLQLRKATMGEHLIEAGLNLSDQQHLDRVNEYFADSSLILMNKQPIGLIKLGVYRINCTFDNCKYLHNIKVKVLAERY